MQRVWSVSCNATVFSLFARREPPACGLLPCQFDFIANISAVCSWLRAKPAQLHFLKSRPSSKEWCQSAWWAECELSTQLDAIQISVTGFARRYNVSIPQMHADRWSDKADKEVWRRGSAFCETKRYWCYWHYWRCTSTQNRWIWKQHQP